MVSEAVTALYTYPVKGCHRIEHDQARVEPWGLAGDRRWLVVDPDGVGITQRDTPALVALRPRPRPAGIVLAAAGRPHLDVAEPVTGEPVEVRVFRSKPPVPARLAGPAADAWFSALLDRPARLAWLDDPTARPVRRALRRTGEPVSDAETDADRVSFADAYPLLVANAASLEAVNGWLDEPVPITRFRPNLVVGGFPAWAEDGWIGRRLRVGEVVLRIAGPCDRCVVTTIDQETGEKGREPLHALGRFRRDDLGLLFGMNAIPDGTGVIRLGDPVELLL